jgi:hypothetical protein
MDELLNKERLLLIVKLLHDRCQIVSRFLSIVGRGSIYFLEKYQFGTKTFQLLHWLKPENEIKRVEG